jgi:hypothetical protein
MPQYFFVLSHATAGALSLWPMGSRRPQSSFVGRLV